MKTIYIQLDVALVKIRVTVDTNLQQQDRSLTLIDKDGNVVGSFDAGNVLGWWIGDGTNG